MGLQSLVLEPLGNRHRDDRVRQTQASCLRLPAGKGQMPRDSQTSSQYYSDDIYGPDIAQNMFPLKGYMVFSPNSTYFFLFDFETRSYNVAQAGLKLIM